ncbi:MAG: helix-turn-helix domain-containing protein [Haloplanus sp.]
MSQSPTAAATVRRTESADAATVVDDQETVQEILDALNDDDCRAILDATSEDARSATELIEACDVPGSTMYRKLDVLTDVGLLGERTRLNPSGHHASEYVRIVDDVTVSVGDGETIELELSHRECPGRLTPGSGLLCD